MTPENQDTTHDRLEPLTDQLQIQNALLLEIVYQLREGTRIFDDRDPDAFQDAAMWNALEDNLAALRQLDSNEIAEAVTDGGIDISPEEFEKRIQARSSTPDEDRPSCPGCGSISLSPTPRMEGATHYCDECREHYELARTDGGRSYGCDLCGRSYGSMEAAVRCCSQVLRGDQA